jgi:chitodextrinase
VIRYDSAKGEGRWTNLNSNGTKPDTVSWLNFVNGLGETSPQFVMGHFYFTVTGSAGATTSTSARFESVANRAGKALDTLINKRQATLTVTSGGGGGGGNRAPVARPGGPYTGTAGSAVSLNGSTSSDPDGSISGYNWTFGDGGTGTGASPSHVYGAAGTYTVTLTVTDNQGATNSASTTASISASGGGGGNQPPVARPGGPYSGTAGLGIAFSGTASSDPEGSPLTYSWNYGDGSAPGTGRNRSTSTPRLAHTLCSSPSPTIRI